jgi:hypothetical protein
MTGGAQSTGLDRMRIFRFAVFGEFESDVVARGAARAAEGSSFADE